MARSRRRRGLFCPKPPFHLPPSGEGRCLPYLWPPSAATHRRLPAAQALLCAARAFYLPGVAPREYANGDKVEINVHKLSSPKTHLPYDYYSLAFCRPEETVHAAENLGEVMTGAVIQNSVYDIYMGKSEFKIACRSVLSKPQKQALSQRVRQDYRVHMIMDNLPAATKMIAELPDGSKKDM